MNGAEETSAPFLSKQKVVDNYTMENICVEFVKNHTANITPAILPTST